MKNCAYSLISVGLLLCIQGNSPVFAENNEEKQMLIVFDEGISQQEIDQKVEAVDGDVKETFEQVGITSVEVPEESIDDLRKDPSVEHVEEDTLVHLSEQIEDWGIPVTNIPDAWNSGFTGEGVKIAVIDSGIAPHSDLAVAGGVSTVGYTSSYSDDQGHGTHVAGIIGARNNGFGVKGAAYESEIYAVKAFDQEGAAYLSDLLEGIDWSISNGMDIINLSSGTQTASAALQSAVDQAYESGLLIVAAAGNDGAPDGLKDTVDFPARYSSVIGVGAVDSYFNRASFSSTGPAVEVAAPGVKILSTYLGNQYAYMSGTSMAAPYVTGELALLKQAYPELANEELRRVLVEHTQDLGTEGRDPFFGYGLIRASSFTKQEFKEINPLSAITLNENSLSGMPGDVISVIASATYKNGEVQNITNEAEWSSANPAVATVEDGRVELKGYGSTAITVTYEDQSAVVMVDVPAPEPEPNPVVKLEAAQTILTGQPGDSVEVTVSATYKNGEVQNVTNRAEWSSANSAVATVQDGRVELKGYGSTTITVTYEGQSTMIVVNSPEPQPEPNPVVKLETSSASLTGTPGDMITVTASATYKNGEVQNVTNGAEWSSADNSIATVESGRVELKGYGSTTLTAAYAGETAVIIVTVPEPQPEPVTETGAFQDVPSFYAPAVEYLVRNQITQGLSQTEFGVQKDIIRADAAIWLAKELNLNTERAEESGFMDVPPRAAGAVNALKQAGIIGGKTVTRFGASDPLTRGEVALILQRAYNLSGDGRSSSFTDVSSRYKEAVDALVANNITSGYTETQFGVSRNITRGQLAVFLYRLSSE
ncbi:S8 family serine peptidase [Domibacillus sp. PGB-M46]|uniref:S8 family serine peptidase n=1 Tax=Domibacillus sp. PGB-M46 TaxID=2910255 RepID=UPI001F5A1DDA|nr:S8 family serine peptidase [Domibacillus sp. PGB-M46]MCI2255596.1 S8 family serine peptidase [Domibacillus sp. PGB-M46]